MFSVVRHTACQLRFVTLHPSATDCTRIIGTVTYFCPCPVFLARPTGSGGVSHARIVHVEVPHRPPQIHPRGPGRKGKSGGTMCRPVGPLDGGASPPGASRLRLKPCRAFGPEDPRPQSRRRKATEEIRGRKSEARSRRSQVRNGDGAALAIWSTGRLADRAERRKPGATGVSSHARGSLDCGRAMHGCRRHP